MKINLDVFINPLTPPLVIAALVLYIIPAIQVTFFAYLPYGEFTVGCHKVAEQYISSLGKKYTGSTYNSTGRGQPTILKRVPYIVFYKNKDSDNEYIIDGLCIHDKYKGFIFEKTRIRNNN